MDEHAPQRDPEAPPVELIAVRAHNPGPMTLSGTNSYVLRDDGRVWVVDPGPRDPEHLAELLLRCGPEAHPQGVLVTHRHLDHTAGVVGRIHVRDAHAAQRFGLGGDAVDHGVAHHRAVVVERDEGVGGIGGHRSS